MKNSATINYIRRIRPPIETAPNAALGWPAERDSCGAFQFLCKLRTTAIASFLPPLRNSETRGGAPSCLSRDPCGRAAFPHHMQNRPERGRLRRRICRPLETTGKYESSSLPSCAAAGLRLPISRPISPNTAPISASVFTAFISIADLTLNCAANPALTPLCRWTRKSSGKIFRAFRASAP